MAQQSSVQQEAVEERRLAMTYEEFLAWSDEDVHAEWVDGEVIVFMPPSIRHQEIIGFLYGLLSLYIQVFDLGKVLFAPCEMRAIPGGPAREPDLLYVARERLDRVDAQRVTGPADLVIEVVSDTSLARDRAVKFYEYQEAGVREYWIIDPRFGLERVDFFQLNAQGKYVPALPDAAGRYYVAVLPGFWIDPNWFWQDPLPKPLTLLKVIAPQALDRLLSTSTDGSGETA